MDTVVGVGGVGGVVTNVIVYVCTGVARSSGMVRLAVEHAPSISIIIAVMISNLFIGMAIPEKSNDNYKVIVI